VMTIPITIVLIAQIVMTMTIKAYRTTAKFRF